MLRLCPELPAMATRKFLDEPEARVVARACVLLTWIAEPDNQPDRCLSHHLTSLLS
jgi:hypothetical protein